MTHRNGTDELAKIVGKENPQNSRAALEDVWNNLQTPPKKIGGGEESFEDFRARVLTEINGREPKELLIKEVAELLGLEDWDNLYENFIGLDVGILERIQKHAKNINGAADLIAKKDAQLIAHLYCKFQDEAIISALRSEKEFDALIKASSYESFNLDYTGEADVGGN